jgi:hypothetical protein
MGEKVSDIEHNECETSERHLAFFNGDREKIKQLCSDALSGKRSTFVQNHDTINFTWNIAPIYSDADIIGGMIVGFDRNVE